MKYFVLVLCVVAAMADPHLVTLDAHEVQQVQTAWKAVHHNEIEILYTIFKEHPDIMARFPKFHGKDLEKLKGTVDFAVHAGRIIGFFGEYISLLGSDVNKPAIKTLLHDMASDHKDRGIPKEMFNEFRTTMMSYLKGHSTWNSDVEHSWNDAFDNAFAHIFTVLDDHTHHH